MKFEKIDVLTDVRTGERVLWAKGDGGYDKVGTIPRTKWKAVSGMMSKFHGICLQHNDWGIIRSECQSLIDAAPFVSPGDVSAQVFDPLKLVREGTPVGDLLAKAAGGDHSAMRKFLVQLCSRKCGAHLVAT
jgi:hypothetical protein